MRIDVFQRWLRSLIKRPALIEWRGYRRSVRRPRSMGMNSPAAIELLDARVLLSATTIVPAADGYATDQGLDGTFDTLDTTSTNSITEILKGVPSPLEDRGLLDFSLANFSAGSHVNSATLSLTAVSITGPSGSSVIIDIEGYSRSGALTPADAAASATQIGSVTVPNNVGGLITYAITLNSQFVQGLLGNASDLGIITRIDPASAGYETGFYSSRATYVPVSERPSLAIDSTAAQPGLTVSTNVSSIAENAGPGAVTGTVTRQNTDLSQPLTVSLASSDTTQATVPATVVIAAGQASATFGISPVSDTILDGTEQVTVTASSSGFSQGSATLSITDYETLSLSLAASTIAENAGAAATTGTVTRNNTNIDQPLTVNLSSNNTNQATVPATVTIAAGQASATFPINAVDDIVVNGTHSVTISAAAAGYAGPASALLQVIDADGGHIRPQDILVSTNNAGSTLALVDEFTTAGLLVQQFTAPATEESRDLVVDENGQIQLYNGTFSPTLTTIDPATGNSSEQAIPGLSTVNNVSFGGIATFHQFVYLTDMGTAGAGAPQGVVRVDLTDRSWQRFATDKQFQDLTIGGDGLLYGLDGSGLPGNQITVYNPVTMAQVRTFSLPFNDYRGIAVSATGDVFASGWDGTISHFDASGNLLASVATGVNNLSSIDLSASGTLIAGSRFNQVVVTDTSLNPATLTHFNVSIQPQAGPPVFAAFAASTIFPSPTLDMTPGSATYVDNDPPAAIDAGLLITTDGEPLTGATVQIGAGFQANQDSLGFTDQNGITGSYNQATGLLTLSGTATADQYQAALRSVTYGNSSADTSLTVRRLTFSVTDGTYSVSAPKTIKAFPPDVPPVIAAGQSFNVAELPANGTIVGTVQASDVDSPQSALQAYTIVSGNTNNAFAINPATGKISVADGTQLEYETTRSFTLGVTVSDGQKTSAAVNVTVNVLNANDDPPVITAGQSFSVAELPANGTVVGTVAATDVDSPPSALQGYAIVSGNTNNAFAINAVTGQITVADGTQLEYETTSSFTLGVTVSDGTNTSAAANVTVSVLNANDDAPVITAGQSFNVAELPANGTVVGTVLASDVDSPPSALQGYAIVSGNTNNAFAINAATGQITVADGTQLEYETTSSFTLGVTVSDGTNTSAAGNVTIGVVNANDDPPVITAGQSFNVAELPANGTVVGTVAATDVDSPASALTGYAIVSGNTNNAFAINAATGQITVADGTQLEYETTSSFTLGVTVSDGTNTSAAANVTVSVVNANDDAPVITAGQSFNVAELPANGTVVGTVLATDVDSPPSALQGYAIVSGNTNNAFAINATTGQVTVADGTQLEYETTSSFTLGVTVSDGKNTSSAASVTISVLNANDDPPVITAGQSFSVAELPANGTVVGTVLATDVDSPPSALQGYAIVSGNTNNAFAINAATGQITVADGTQLEYETTSSFTLGVTVSDGKNTSSAGSVTVGVLNANDDPPVINAGQSFSVAELPANGTVVGTVLATDVDSPPSALQGYAIVSGNTNNAFAINAATGQITVANGAQLEYETTNSFTLGVTVSDGKNTSAAANVAVSVLNANDDPPVITAGQAFNVAELPANGTVVGTVAATDVDSPASALQGYAIVSGNTNNAFAINAATGQITVANGAQLEYETTNSFTLGVTVSDGKNTSAAANIAISVMNANDDPPVITAGQAFSVAELPANGTVVGTVAATDVDSPASALQGYAIVSGNTNNAFAINAATGQITVANGAQLEYETTNSFTLGVTVSDGKNTSAPANVAISVLNANDDPPVITASQAFSVAELPSNGTVVGMVLATDVDSPPSALQGFAIVSGNTNNAFAINAATGQITVANGAQLEYETTNSYTLGVTVSDGKNTSSAASVTISVLNANDDPPVITAGQSFNVAELPANGTVVGTVAATDVDSPASALQGYAIVSGNTNNAFAINAATGQITVANGAQLEYETTNSFTLGVTVSDGKNTSAAANVAISVINANDDPPVITAGQSFSVAELAANGTAVGKVLATDVDSPASALTGFAIVSGNTNNAFAINAATGQITVTNSSQLDSETAGSFTLGVTVSDGKNTSAAGNVTIGLLDVTAPPVIGNQSFSLLEKSPNGSAVGTVTATNPDADDALSFTIVSGNTNNAFAINAATGQITVADASKLNFLVQPTYSLSVRAADGSSPSQAATATVTIQLIFQPAIDIKPGDATHTVNLSRDATIQVAILSTANFNATTQVNVSSLRFGRTGSEASLQVDKKGHPQFSYQDVNGDGRLDLVVSFVTSKTGLQTTDTQAVLTGNLVSGASLESFGPVHVVTQTHTAAVASQSTIQPATTTIASSPATMPIFVAPTPDNSSSIPLFVDDQASKGTTLPGT